MNDSICTEMAEYGKMWQNMANCEEIFGQKLQDENWVEFFNFLIILYSYKNRNLGYIDVGRDTCSWKGQLENREIGNNEDGKFEPKLGNFW